MFEILKISRAEIRHSNMLSWLLNPKENHGLGDSVLRGFIGFIATIITEDIFDVLMDCYSFSIQREWCNIDLLAVSSEKKFVICIENKIDTGEHDNQLQRYRKVIEDTYPKYKRVYIFLSPDGREASEPDHWWSMSYQDVLEIIENSRKKIQLSSESELLINNYVDTIRRYIVGDDRLVQICKNIYIKHQKALDLIFENKPDKASDLAKIFQTWANQKNEEGRIEIVLDKCEKKYTRFKTKRMSELLPDSETALSGWNTKNYYFYEIFNNQGKEFYIQLAFNSKGISAELRSMCDRIMEYCPDKAQSEDWQWINPYSTKHSDVGEELLEERIFAQLNNNLKEIEEFEKNLMENLQMDE